MEDEAQPHGTYALTEGDTRLERARDAPLAFGIAVTLHTTPRHIFRTRACQAPNDMALVVFSAEARLLMRILYVFDGFKVLRHGPGPIPAPPATLFRVGSGTPPGMCALIWEMGGGAPLAPYPMASCARSPFRARLDAGIPGVRRGGDWWWCRHMEAWAPMGAGAWVGRAGVVCGVDPYRNSFCRPALRLSARRAYS